MKRKLFLFFTRNTGLKDWEQSGILERELKYYTSLVEQGFEVAFVSYDIGSQKRLRRLIYPITLVCNQWRLSDEMFLWWVINVHARFVRRSAVVKTNQIIGGGVAKRFAVKRGLKLVVRAGHLPSDTALWRHGEASDRAKKIEDREGRILLSADRVVLTTEFMKTTVIEKHGISPRRIDVIPNYVDTDLFEPARLNKSEFPRAGYVGRLEPKKNVINLAKAFEGLDLELEIVGEGSLREELEATAKNARLNLLLRGQMANSMLAKFYQSLSFYVQPSHLEHHPKTLIEAMACGLPVIASNRKGNRELIQNMRTGILCETDSSSIRKSIVWILEHPEEAIELGSNARQFVADNFSMETVLKAEIKLLKRIATTVDH